MILYHVFELFEIANVREQHSNIRQWGRQWIQIFCNGPGADSRMSQNAFHEEKLTLWPE